MCAGPGTRRAVIVIDENGVVRHRHVHRLGLGYQNVDDLRKALDELGGRRAQRYTRRGGRRTPCRA